jgi:methylthioribulose-1-phosphate dehydratase
MLAATAAAAARRLIEAGRALAARGWLPAGSGNLSAVVGRDPLRLLVSRSGADKGHLTDEDLVLVDGEGRPVDGGARPSDETALHLAVVATHGARAGAVLHTHSVWATLLSDLAAPDGELVLEGYELLKGLAGVTTHGHAERVPVLENSQDYAALGARVAAALAARPQAHGLLLRRHGLYAWGQVVDAARRHLEALETLFEVEGRRRQLPAR